MGSFCGSVRVTVNPSRRYQASTTHVLSGRRGDLQLGLAAYGGGSASLSAEQQEFGACPSVSWRRGGGIPFPPSLPQTAGVTLSQADSLRQLVELEADGALNGPPTAAGGGGDDEVGPPPAGAAARETDAEAEVVGGAVAAGPVASAVSAATSAPAVGPACSFFAAAELNPGGARPGVEPAAAVALEALCAPVAAAAGHAVQAVSVIGGHALAVACASLPHSSKPPTASPKSLSRAAAVDATAVPTRVFVRDPLSDALQAALMAEDAVSSVHPESVRQVRWLFRSHVESGLLVDRTIGVLRKAIAAARAQVPAQTLSESAAAIGPAASVASSNLQRALAELAEARADLRRARADHDAVVAGMARNIVIGAAPAPLESPIGFDPLTLQASGGSCDAGPSASLHTAPSLDLSPQEAVPRRTLPFIRVWDTAAAAAQSRNAWAASGAPQTWVSAPATLSAAALGCGRHPSHRPLSPPSRCAKWTAARRLCSRLRLCGPLNAPSAAARPTSGAPTPATTGSG